jgi:ATP-dependent DNA ligase
MEAATKESLPEGPEWLYEPKWDGFRCVVYRDGNLVHLQAKSGQPLERYFPEVVERVRRIREQRFVVDGELVIPRGKTLSFDDLLMRIHPAASRVRTLAAETPAWLVVFDLLAQGSRALFERPLRDRRAWLEKFMKSPDMRADGLSLSPATFDIRQARRWLSASGAALDGVMAKRADLPYHSGDRHAMVKVKRRRTADCVVGGFRYASEGRIVGSLLLGLYDAKGVLHHVGFTSSLKRADRAALTPKLETLVKPPGFTGRAPGGPSRWSTERSSEWQPLAPKLVVEVEFDHFSQRRFRHGTKFLRWRPDKAPRQCTFEQVTSRSAAGKSLLGV